MFCSRPLVCVPSFVGGVAVSACVPAGCVVCAWWGVLFVGCVLSCGGAGGGVACSRLLLSRVFLFVWRVVGVGLCAFARGWCGLVWVCVVGVGLCGFPRLFFRVVGFLACGFFVGVVRFSCLPPVFVCRALGFRFSLFRPFVLSKFLLRLLGFGALPLSPCHY